MICKICNTEVGSVGYHCSQVHNLSSEGYYRRFLMRPDEDKCIICGGQIKFKSIAKGFGSKTCSPKCFLTLKARDKNFQDKRIGKVKEFFSDDSNRAEFAARTKIQMNTEESKSRSRDVMNKLREDESFLAKRAEGHKAYWEDPLNQKVQSEHTKTLMADPEFKKKAMEGTKRLWEDPEYRQMQAEKGSKIFSKL